MPYTVEDLLLVLRPYDELKVEAVTQSRRRVENGLLSVGLKLHCLKEDDQIDSLFDALGGKEAAQANKMYRHSESAVTFVLPPLGNARTAVLLIECLESYLGYNIFGNPNFLIQVCSPCRLEPRYAAILTIAFYLGSDLLRRYKLEKLATTFTHWSGGSDFNRGRRIALYDGKGALDQQFEWWGLEGGSVVIAPSLPFKTERTDVLTCQTRVDIKNVNLVATLLAHHQRLDYWEHHGLRLIQEMEKLLDKHLLSGLLNCSWIHPADGTQEDDSAFFSAYQELETYVFEEHARLTKKPWWRLSAGQRSGILFETRQLLDSLYKDVAAEAAKITRGRAP